MRRFLISTGCLSLVIPDLSPAQVAQNAKGPLTRPAPGAPGGGDRPGGGHGGSWGGGGHHRPPGGWSSNRPIFGWNGHRYHAGRFRYPTGWRYRRWSRGQAPPLLFLTTAYFFTN